MTTARQQDLLVGLAIALSACASSPSAFDGADEADEPAVEPDDETVDEDDQGTSEDDDESEPTDEEGGQTVRGPMQGPQTGNVATDAGPPVVRAPAGSSRDAGSSPGATSDSGTGRSPSVPIDAGRGEGSGEGTAGSNSCVTDTDCTNSCVPIGILPCCNLLNTCGCTWAPGAYCL